MRTRLLAATALSTSAMFLVPGVGLAQAVNWSGFYTGFGLGAGPTQSTLSFDYAGSDVTLPSLATFTGTGTVGTLETGYNFQQGTIVFGLAADGSVTAFSGSASGSSFGASESINSLLSMRGRLGVAFDRFMVFGTAGIAAGQASFTTDVGKGDPVSSSGIVVGTVTGGGVEYAVTDKVSLTAQAKFYNLSQLTAVGDAGKGSPSDPYTATYTPRPVVFESGINVHY